MWIKITFLYIIVEPRLPMTNQYTTSTWAQLILNQKFTAVKLNKKYKENTSVVWGKYYEQPVRATRYEVSYELRVEYTATQKTIII